MLRKVAVKIQLQQPQRIRQSVVGIEGRARDGERRAYVAFEGGER